MGTQYVAFIGWNTYRYATVAIDHSLAHRWVRRTLQNKNKQLKKKKRDATHWEKGESLGYLGLTYAP